MGPQFKRVIILVLIVSLLGVGVHYYKKKRGNYFLNSQTNHSEKKGISDFGYEEERALSKKAETSVSSSLDSHSNNMPSGPESFLFANSGNKKGGAEGDQCSSLEYRGSGSLTQATSSTDGAHLLEMFHDSKRILLTWLSNYSDQIPERTYMLLRAKVLELKLVRPPSLEEADLNWRGIGVRHRVGDEMVLQMSSGFVALVKRKPKRAQFEMTRLVAQSWSPCELGAEGIHGFLKPLLECLGFNEDSCKPGEFSESGWAASSSLSALLSPPDCVIPVFKDANRKACLLKSVVPFKSKSNKGEKS